MMTDLISIVANTILADNLALSYFLGMCTYLAVSTGIGTALGTGVAITVILTIRSESWFFKTGSFHWHHCSYGANC